MTNCMSYIGFSIVTNIFQLTKDLELTTYSNSGAPFLNATISSIESSSRSTSHFHCICSNGSLKKIHFLISINNTTRWWSHYNFKCFSSNGEFCRRTNLSLSMFFSNPAADLQCTNHLDIAFRLY